MPKSKPAEPPPEVPAPDDSAEPQEGAPAAMEMSSNGCPASPRSAGVPSCGSDLAAIRQLLDANDVPNAGAGFTNMVAVARALLRMVYELRAVAAKAIEALELIVDIGETRVVQIARDTLYAEKLKEWRRANGYAVELRDMTTERDELRAKLADSEQQRDDDNHAYNEREALLIARALLAEEKLMEAASLRELDLIALCRTRERADAAEARVKELERMLKDKQ